MSLHLSRASSCSRCMHWAGSPLRPRASRLAAQLLTRSPSRFVGVLRLLPGLGSIRFHGWLLDRRTWRKGVFSFKYRRRNETNEYHPAQQSPHENDWLPRNENVHARTSGDEEPPTISTSGLRFPLLYCKKAPAVF